MRAVGLFLLGVLFAGNAEAQDIQSLLQQQQPEMPQAPAMPGIVSPEPPPQSPGKEDDVAQFYGLGLHTCDEWLSDASRDHEGIGWVLGFVSGLNMFNKQSHGVGKTINGKGIIDDVKKHCQEHKDTKIVEATLAVYLELAREQK